MLCVIGLFYFPGHLYLRSLPCKVQGENQRTNQGTGKRERGTSNLHVPLLSILQKVALRRVGDAPTKPLDIVS